MSTTLATIGIAVAAGYLLYKYEGGQPPSDGGYQKSSDVFVKPEDITVAAITYARPQPLSSPVMYAKDFATFDEACRGLPGGKVYYDAYHGYSWCGTKKEEVYYWIPENRSKGLNPGHVSNVAPW